MHNEFTAIIERDEDWYIAYCPEIPGANGQGRTVDECKKSLAAAIALIQMEAVPRHTEIPNNLARKICRGLSVSEIGR